MTIKPTSQSKHRALFLLPIKQESPRDTLAHRLPAGFSGIHCTLWSLVVVGNHPELALCQTFPPPLGPDTTLPGPLAFISFTLTSGKPPASLTCPNLVPYLGNTLLLDPLSSLQKITEFLSFLTESPIKTLVFQGQKPHSYTSFYLQHLSQLATFRMKTWRPYPAFPYLFPVF